MDNYLKKLFRRLSHKHRPTAPNGHNSLTSMAYYLAENDEDLRRQILKQNRETKQAEIQPLKDFIRTGSILNGPIGARLTEEGVIQVTGAEVSQRRVIFTMDKENLTIDRKRGSHVKRTLTRLAAREGLELVISPTKIQSVAGINMAFWKFKNRGEVDDSELVNKVKPRVKEETASAERIAIEQMQEYILQNQQNQMNAYYGNSIQARPIVIRSSSASDDIPF